MTDLVWVLVLGLPASFFLTKWVLQYAVSRQVLDIPGARSSHTVATPRGGGLSIVVVVLVGSTVSAMWTSPLEWPRVCLCVLAAIAIAVVSWLDDLHSLPAIWRLGVHVLCALGVIVALGYWESIALPLVGPVDLSLGGLVLSLLWVVGLTNAYNFMDGIDGLAGAQAVVSGLAYTVVGLHLGARPLAVAGLLLAISSLGFLAFNWPPARIFMGDVGAAFLGFSFGTLALAGSRLNARVPLAAVMILGPFVFDSALTFTRRLLAGERVFTAHRSHLYQRLVIAGHSHREVTLLYTATSAVCALAGILSLVGGNLAGTVALALAGLSLVRLWLLVRREERAASARRELAPKAQ